VQKIAQNLDTQRKSKLCVTAKNCTPDKEQFQLTYTPIWILYGHGNRIRRNCPRRDSNTRQTSDRKTVTDRGGFWLAGMASTWCSSCQLAGPNVATSHVLFLCREKVSNLSDILTPKHLPAGKNGTCHFTSTPVRRWSYYVLFNRKTMLFEVLVVRENGAFVHKRTAENAYTGVPAKFHNWSAWHSGLLNTGGWPTGNHWKNDWMGPTASLIMPSTNPSSPD
jgi:hypothetical protein